MGDWTFSIPAKVSVTFLKRRSAWASMLVSSIHFPPCAVGCYVGLGRAWQGVAVASLFPSVRVGERLTSPSALKCVRNSSSFSDETEALGLSEILCPGVSRFPWVARV